MIKQLEGSIISTADQYIVIEAVKGIGLQVFVPTPSEYTIGDSVRLYTHMVVRENNISLYGFPTVSHEKVFITLLSIPKVGAKMALSILSAFSLQDLFQTISEGVPEALSKTPGIGATTAKKIHLYLSEKWKDDIPMQDMENEPSCYEEAHDLLVEMGLSPLESKTILKRLRLQGNTASTAEEIVKEVLKART
ncbi:MAG: Holliday junction ATP-dependent DNA helicase RuvA [Caldisericia bacterium]|nr:Holliday junction ATP-dependent DNA helicase RuvA [Caldisericia bacterium]MDD4614744.1 Holliday junction ATP-dependent DNA helicase RuvA [Caldisericia bacterium]